MHTETAQEKWYRLTHPKMVADYGLSLSESELETFEEGRAILSELKSISDEDKHYRKVIAEVGANARQSLESVCCGVIGKS